ncbi:MAG: hypothetical protein BWY42_00984 [Candidatus Omnitrophica bacterium ADurb.Bin277]|nr:MAG: hypothetical protein BWY42_00984 [Candidatus Omnitrophica bacterium ADurb.Bin277]
MIRKSLVLVAALVCLHLAGCATAEKILPLHDETLVYDLPLDLTYLRTMEAVDSRPGWELEGTDKEKGIIKVRNVQYSRLDDSDKRSLTILVRRISAARTSVALAPESQRSLGGGDMLQTIKEKLNAEQ